MIVEQKIISKLQAQFQPEQLWVENESGQHAVPENSETHFKVLIVSQKFTGLSRVERQQLIYKILAEELNSGVHALSQRTYTPEEWIQVKDTLEFISPQCMGSSKRT
ncbi:MAG: BolA family transcriptional regulator [Bdellovibrionales bacterium]|nr:BolA family transcriptional regulator [Bdellovibrionales bacterium]